MLRMVPVKLKIFAVAIVVPGSLGGRRHRPVAVLIQDDQFSKLADTLNPGLEVIGYPERLIQIPAVVFDTLGDVGEEDVRLLDGARRMLGQRLRQVDDVDGASR